MRTEKTFVAVLLVIALLGLSGCGGSPEPESTPTAQAKPKVDLRGVKMMSYYPSNGGWTSMWTQWQPDVIDRDFARIADLNGNAVRVVIQPQAFDFPHPTAEMKQRLNEVLTMAERHGLRAELTLFDWWNDYGEIGDSKKWAHELLDPHRNDTRVFAIEVQNEIDPTDAAAVAWAKAMVPYVQKLTKIPVTISVKDTGGVATLKRLKSSLGSSTPDFYTYHFYAHGNGEDAVATLRAAMAVAGDKGLFIGETGRPTTPSTNAPTSEQETRQAIFLNQVSHAVGVLDLPPPAVWTLTDFQPDAIPAHEPTPSDEYHYGLFRLDGSEKPAAAVIRGMFSGDKPAPVLNGGFEQGSDLADGWIGITAGGATIQRDTTVAHSGSASIRLSQTQGNASSSPGVFTVPVSGIETATGVKYRATAWARGAASSGENTVAIAWYRADRSYIDTSNSPRLTNGNTTWRQLSVEAVAPPGASYAELIMHANNNRGTVWFDDATFARSDS